MKPKIFLIVGFLLAIISCGDDKKNATEEITTLPILTTSDITNIDVVTATCGGTITSDGGALVIQRGVCWGTSSEPTISNSISSDGEGTGSFTSALTGLKPNTSYYVRAYASNKGGTAYGNTLIFKTLDGAVDMDGNVYHAITIGAQTWLAENLSTTKYNDGRNIPLVTNTTEWKNLTTPGYCWYDNDPATFADTYGALYNWYTVNTGNLCPTGWQVPTDAEWTALTHFLGDESIAGSRLKETGNTHWAYPNTDATNETGFTALPGGLCDNNGSFSNLGYYGYWWSSTVGSSTHAIERHMVHDNSSIYGYDYYKKFGLSVRCLKH